MFAAETSAVPIPVPDVPSGESPPDWKQIIQSVDPFLQRVADQLADQIQAFDPDIAAYAEYALTAQGKQLRPALVALSGNATGRTNESHVLVAVIIEMVHLATLVHDDVMDEAEVRRGRPTLAANWGNELSVLLGDCLFAHAVKLAADFPTPEICRAVAAATNTVCAGEIVQTRQRRNFRLSRADYFRAIEMKTGELFALSCDLGALQSNATTSQRAVARHYGLALGTAYQIYDDCLDLFGNEAAAGKSLGTDLAKGKLTLPVLMLLERAGAGDRAEIETWLRDWSPAGLPPLLQRLAQFDALAASREVIRQLLGKARQALEGLPPSESRRSLNGLTDFLLQQVDALGETSRLAL